MNTLLPCLNKATGRVCADEKTSIQAREAEQAPRPAIHKHPVYQSPRYHRRGALHLMAADDALLMGSSMGSATHASASSTSAPFSRQLSLRKPNVVVCRREPWCWIMVRPMRPSSSPALFRNEQRRQMENYQCNSLGCLPMPCGGYLGHLFGKIGT